MNTAPEDLLTSVVDLTDSPPSPHNLPVIIFERTASETGTFSMEENNNDPNNNSDHAQVSRPERSMARDEPQPGCSKDFAAASSSPDSGKDLQVRNKLMYNSDSDSSISDSCEDSVDSVAVKMRPTNRSYENTHSTAETSSNSNYMENNKGDQSRVLQNQILDGSEQYSDLEKEDDDYYNDESDIDDSENYSSSAETLQSSNPEDMTDEDIEDTWEENNDDLNKQARDERLVIEKDVTSLLHLFPHIEEASARYNFSKYRNHPNKSMLVIQELLNLKPIEKTVLHKRKIADDCPVAMKKSHPSEGQHCSTQALPPSSNQNRENLGRDSNMPTSSKVVLSPAKFNHTSKNGIIHNHDQIAVSKKSVLTSPRLVLQITRPSQASSTMTSTTCVVKPEREVMPGPSGTLSMTKQPPLLHAEKVIRQQLNEVRSHMPIAAAQLKSEITHLKAMTAHSKSAAAPPKLTPAVQNPYVMNVAPISDRAGGSREKIQHTATELASTDLESQVKNLSQPSVYYDLVNMFPNVSREYILKSCKKYTQNQSKDSILNELIDKMLSRGDKHPRAVQVPAVVDKATQQQTEAMSLEERYDTLLKIFPDADPNYLRQKVESLYKDQQAYQEFVQTTMETKDYPSKEAFLKQMKLRDQIRQYTTEFNIEQFLRIFPDPGAYFCDSKRTTNELLAVAYLKYKYSKLRLTTISKTFHAVKNLTLACFHLDKKEADMSKRRVCAPPMPSDNIPFIQEIAYIENRQNIEQYIKEKRQREKIEFKELKKAGQLIECQCCFNDECLPSACFHCNDGHVFCKECLIRGTDAKLSESNTHIQCFVECQEEFPLSVLQKVLEPTKFSILVRKRQEAEVMAAGLEGLVSCPFCHFSSIPPLEDKVFRCFNPDCMKESCRACKEPNHVPYKCEEVKAEKLRHYVEEKMTEALLRTCYRCKKQFCKDGGCNKMTCPCGAIMCYLCDQPVRDYTHFRGQGLKNENLCPLYTDDKRVDAEVVRRTALLAEKEVLKRNPNLKLDTATLLPDLPKPQKGPHQAIVNAGQLPEHALRARAYMDLPPKVTN